jgi:hypothetical protein
MIKTLVMFDDHGKVAGRMSCTWKDEWAELNTYFSVLKDASDDPDLAMRTFDAMVMSVDEVRQFINSIYPMRMRMRFQMLDGLYLLNSNEPLSDAALEVWYKQARRNRTLREAKV